MIGKTESQNHKISAIMNWALAAEMGDEP